MDSHSSALLCTRAPVAGVSCSVFRLSESLGRGKSPMPMNSELAVEGFPVLLQGLLWSFAVEALASFQGRPPTMKALGGRFGAAALNWSGWKEPSSGSDKKGRIRVTGFHANERIKKRRAVIGIREL